MVKIKQNNIKTLLNLVDSQKNLTTRSPPSYIPQSFCNKSFFLIFEIIVFSRKILDRKKEYHGLKNALNNLQL